MSHASLMMYTVRRCGGLCVPSSARAGRTSVQLRASATSSSPLAAVQLASSTLAQKLLADDTYHITFHGYLHNHVKHAIIALHGLQAPPGYTHEVPYGYKLEPAQTHSGQAVDPQTLETVRGHKKLFPELMEFFDRELRELGEDEVLEKYAPAFASGMAAGLTHGIIHLGWALDFGSRPMLVEGLALMAYQGLSIHPERFEHSALSDTTPVDSLVRAARVYADQNVPEAIQGILAMPKYSLEAEWHPELHVGEIEWQVSKVLEEGHGIFQKLPQWLDTAPVGEALEDMYKATALLYLVSAGEPKERKMGDFVVLHFNTSLWGAEQMLWKLPEEQHRHVLKCYWASINAILATYGEAYPGATNPAAEQLEEAWVKYQTAHDSDNMPSDACHLDLQPEEHSRRTRGEVEGVEEVEGVQRWEQIIRRAWEEDEEHNIKLVYVCRELWRRYGHWRGFRAAAETFTPTPDL